jgi:Ca2+-binding EF-hand superfamily protein
VVKGISFDYRRTGQEKIDIQEFQTYYIKAFTKVSEEEELSEAFKQFDKNNDGFIDAEELRTAMMHFGQKLTAKEAQEMLDLADINGDGKVNYSGIIVPVHVFN